MSTRGYKVFRYKGRYFVYYNHSDSYPSVFGLSVLHEIPRDVSKEEFEEWAKLTGKRLDAQYEFLKKRSGADFVTYRQRRNDLFIEWIYEIDLDNLVFHVDSQPLFRLDNMPPDDVFLKAISYDHFGHRAFDEHTPVQYRYDWRAPPPPPPPKSLIAYNSFPNLSSTTSFHDLLRIPIALSSIEQARTALVELLVTRRMAEHDVGHNLRVLENVPDREHISKRMLELALSLVNFAVGPPISPPPRIIRDNILRDFIWIREDVCLRITTHLDDEDNLHASIGDLVHHINTTPDKVGTVYGIAYSIFHCAVVRLDKDELGASFAHTPALQFLPSFYARKISTPGIEAMSRLGCQTSGVEFLAAISEAYGDYYNLPRITHKESLAARSVIAKVPVEVWMNVGHFISSLIDLVRLASISPQAMSAAADLARYPMVMDFRLVDVVGSISLIPETTEVEDTRCYRCQLGSAKFIAVQDDRRINLELADLYNWVFDEFNLLLFEVQRRFLTDHLSGPVTPVVIMYREHSVWELEGIS
ncbi:hypothetical protein DFH94DRAFT_352945 [Russula ochroleuca]|jgi:hypothetical protein|uniref:Uncharacterized protein n=1 Tax=Russula ochroleuca TaxID=152965 RepID=A0A9P5MNP6_9AGAM|nr:hypothetical protein DFH94DRAFT_352945 [Russula ochroleuca]